MISFPVKILQACISISSCLMSGVSIYRLYKSKSSKTNKSNISTENSIKSTIIVNGIVSLVVYSVTTGIFLASSIFPISMYHWIAIVSILFYLMSLIIRFSLHATKVTVAVSHTIWSFSSRMKKIFKLYCAVELTISIGVSITTIIVDDWKILWFTAILSVVSVKSNMCVVSSFLLFEFVVITVRNKQHKQYIQYIDHRSPCLVQKISQKKQIIQYT